MNQTPRPTRSEQREAARAQAKALREQHKKNERRKGVFIKLGVGLGILGVFAIIAAVVIGGISNNGGSAEKPTNLTADFGIKIGANGEAFTATHTPKPTPSAGATAAPASPLAIVTYVDYQCPYCQMFELANLDQIQGWLNDGTATLEVRPLSFLDGRATPNEYSSRAAGLALAVASFDPDRFFAVNKYLYDNQPAENTAGPSNDAMLSGIQALGVKNMDQITAAVKDGRFQKWILNNTAEVFKVNTDLAGHGTPYVTVNGQMYQGAVDNAAQFAQFVTSLLTK